MAAQIMTKLVFCRLPVLASEEAEELMTCNILASSRWCLLVNDPPTTTSK
jgi:hypothetical protein